jgi:hypothetical protein
VVGVNGLVDESDDESEESESEADDIYRGMVVGVNGLVPSLGGCASFGVRSRRGWGAVPVPGSGVEVGVSRRDIS